MISFWCENYARIFVLGHYLFLKVGTNIIRGKYPSIRVFPHQKGAHYLFSNLRDCRANVM